MTAKSEETISPQSNNHVGNHTDNSETRRKRSRFREFRVRDSIVTTLFENNENIQSVVSFTSALVWFHILVMVLFNRTQLKEDYEFFYWSMIKKFHLFTLMWIELFALYILSYFTAKLMLKRVISVSTYWVFTLATIAISCFLLHYEPWTLKRQLSNALSMAILCEHVRIVMKILAYAFHSVIRTKEAGNKDSDDESNKGHKDDKNSLLHYIYFFFAPVMVYRDSYPKSESPTNWRRVLQLSVHFLGSVYLLLMGLRHIIIPHFSKACKVPLTSADIGHGILLGYWFGIPIMLFGMAHALIHCWHNIFAEILHFGDRHFYLDWWTVTNSADYLRKWNLIVGDWIFEYVYAPLMDKTKSRFLSALTIYSISAILHDYVLYGILGFFLPLHIFVYPTLAVIGDISVVLLNKLKLFRNISRIHGNTLFHMSSYFSFSIWVGISALEYFARVNNPNVIEGNWKERIGLSLAFPKCLTLSD